MKKAIPIDENDLLNVSGGVSANEKAIFNIDEGCEEWKCNVCSSSLKWNFASGNTMPSCKHYAYISCRNCQYFNAQSNSCGKKF